MPKHPSVTPYSTASLLALILSVLVQSHSLIHFQRKDVPNVVLILLWQSSPQCDIKVCQCHPCHRVHTPPEAYIYCRRDRRVVLPFVLLLSIYCSIFHPNHTSIYTMPVQFPMIFSHKHPLTSKSIVDATSTTRSRSSTTITTLEKEFGACEPPKSGATESSSFFLSSHSVFYYSKSYVHQAFSLNSKYQNARSPPLRVRSRVEATRDLGRPCGAVMKKAGACLNPLLKA